MKKDTLAYQHRALIKGFWNAQSKAYSNYLEELSKVKMLYKVMAKCNGLKDIDLLWREDGIWGVELNGNIVVDGYDIEGEMKNETESTIQKRKR